VVTTVKLVVSDVEPVDSAIETVAVPAVAAAEYAIALFVPLTSVAPIAVETVPAVAVATGVTPTTTAPVESLTTTACVVVAIVPDVGRAIEETTAFVVALINAIEPVNPSVLATFL